MKNEIYLIPQINEWTSPSTLTDTNWIEVLKIGSYDLRNLYQGFIMKNFAGIKSLDNSSKKYEYVSDLMKTNTAAAHNWSIGKF